MNLDEALIHLTNKISQWEKKDYNIMDSIDIEAIRLIIKMNKFKIPNKISNYILYAEGKTFEFKNTNLENKKIIEDFNKKCSNERLKILLAKYWLTHSNDYIFSILGYNYVPSFHHQEEARKIIDNDNIALSSADISKISKKIVISFDDFNQNELLNQINSRIMNQINGR